jgi:hypothetical protein
MPERTKLIIVKSESVKAFLHDRSQEPNNDFFLPPSQHAWQCGHTAIHGHTSGTPGKPPVLGNSKFLNKHASQIFYPGYDRLYGIRRASKVVKRI